MARRTGADPEDPYGGRTPTSHERMAGQPWDASYLGEPAPWDIDEPQAAVQRLASEGAFTGTMLDAGCGTGENALHIAARGIPVLGVDVAQTALSVARRKATDRGLDADFILTDALHLDRLDRCFDTVLDCGLFHTFDSAERHAYLAGLASVTGPGSKLYLLCFSDAGPDTGPHPVGEEELRAAFSYRDGWRVVTIEPDRCQARFAPQGAPAWLAGIERIQ